MASINPVYARLITRQLLDEGISEEALYANTGLSDHDLWAFDDIEIAPFQTLLDNCERLTPSTPVGFIIGRLHTTMTLGPMGVAMGAAPNLRDGLQILDNFTRLHANYVRVSLSAHLRGLLLTFEFDGQVGHSLRHHSESTLMLIQNYIETLSGRPLDDAELHFPYSAPAYADCYQQFFSGRVKFDQRATRLVLPATWLNIRSPYFHHELWQQSTRQLSQRMRELVKRDESIYAQHLRAILRSHQPPLPALPEIAAQLHVSERTLNRRLKLEGTNYRQLRGEILDDWARQYLTQTGDSVEAISAALGYQDSANFRRAFRNRVGKSPSNYRADAIGKALQ